MPELSVVEIKGSNILSLADAFVLRKGTSTVCHSNLQAKWILTRNLQISSGKVF